jgi:hypothetical protein
MKKPDCYYYGGGYCDKAVPFTPCEIEGCVCYTPSPKKKDIKVVNEMLENTPQPPVRFKPYELTVDDLETIHTFLYAVKNNKTGCFTFTRLSDEQYEEVLKRFNRWKEGQK